MPQLIIQQQGAADPLWPEAGIEMFDAGVQDDKDWKRVCTLLKDALRSPVLFPFDVFLLFAEAEVLRRRDRPTLQKIIERVRFRTWGVRTLSVLRVGSLIAIDEREIPDLAEWMRTLLDGGVADLIQITEGAELDLQSLCERLRNRTSALGKRVALLQTDPVRRPWRCALPSDWAELAERLGPELAITSADEDTTSDLLIVLNDSNPEEQEGEIERYVADDDDARRAVKIVTYMREPSRRLRQYCRRRRMSEPISVAGDFELWYLLLRLNERAAPADDSIRSVLLDDAPIMRASIPSVLVTCTFGLHEEGQWLEAAAEIGEFLRLAPRDLNFRIEVAISPQRLQDVVKHMHKNMEDVVAWIHIGHGVGRTGLWVPDVGHVPAKEWSECFRDRHLRLALFATCDSHEIARHFAEQGANVAIGFKGQVLSAKARQFSAEVLKALVADGMRGDSILSGFRAGEMRFKSLQTVNATPQAFYPRPERSANG